MLGYGKIWFSFCFRFDIRKKLGQGTYGKVQLGVDKETGQKVAIKTIRKAKIETEADLIRVRREIQIMSSVQHPNIIHIYEGKSQHCFLPGAFINLSPPCAVNRHKQLRKRNFRISYLNPLPPSDAVRKQKIYFRGSFQFSIVTI